MGFLSDSDSGFVALISHYEVGVSSYAMARTMIPANATGTKVLESAFAQRCTHDSSFPADP